MDMTEHPPIQRWQKIFTRYPASEIVPSENGEYVTYADHLAALRACEERVLNAAREAVAALTAGRKRMDYEDGPEVYGAHNAYIDCVRDALAAIKGDQQ